MNSYTDRREAAEKKRADALMREGPPIVLKFGEDSVVLTKQAMEWDYPAGPDKHGGHRDVPFGQKFKSLYKVEHNGIHRGWIICPTGFGKPWEIQRLRQHGPYYYGGSGTKKMRGDNARDKLAAMVPDLVRAGELGTLPEQAEQERAAVERQRKAEAQSAAYHAQLRRERAARAAVDRDTLRDTMNALQALIDRQVLTNFETEIIAKIIDDMPPRIAALDKQAGEKQ